MTKNENSKECEYCGSSVLVGTRKCQRCGEWLRPTAYVYVKRCFAIVGPIGVVISVLFAGYQIKKARLLDEANAMNLVQARFMEIDRLLMEKPEFSHLYVAIDDYQSTLNLVATPEGRKHLQEGQFVSYVFDVFEMEFLLCETYGLVPRGTDVSFRQFVTNPKVIEWWYEEDLRQWYSEDFREEVEKRMPKTVRK